MTLTEKLLARAAGKATVQAGDNIWVNADVLMTHDVCGPGTIGVFKREFGQDAKVWDKNKIVIIPDHYIFTADSKSNRNVDILREFAREQGLPYFYDVIDDPNGHWVFDAAKGNLKRQYGSRYAGVCHTALPAKGHTRPGEVLFGTDSHTCMAGAFNQFATGIGNTDAGFVMGTGKLLIKVPETMHFRLEGKLQPGVMAKDIILHCIGEIGFDGATYRAMQFDGPGAASLSMDDRMTIANMAIEAGGKNAIFEFDSRTAEYVDARVKLNGTKATYEPVERDRDEKFVYEMVRGFEPARTHRRLPSRSGPAQESQGNGPEARPRLCGLLHRRQDQRLRGIRPRAARPQSGHRHLRRARHARNRRAICRRPTGAARPSGTSW